ncbi:hypothetical protein L8C07_09040 [Paenibacillus sp. CMAA1739]|nr:hypothetical protein [Paenibacillus sp. CMAA1739]MEC4566089.1 hypothetical protein [Paenibacillus sp. CMAA1739]
MPEVKDSAERIRFIFPSDHGDEFTDHIIWAIGYLIGNTRRHYF